jgi:hypothetical protein
VRGNIAVAFIQAAESFFLGLHVTDEIVEVLECSLAVNS